LYRTAIAIAVVLMLVSTATAYGCGKQCRPNLSLTYTVDMSSNHKYNCTANCLQGPQGQQGRYAAPPVFAALVVLALPYESASSKGTTMASTNDRIGIPPTFA